MARAARRALTVESGRCSSWVPPAVTVAGNPEGLTALGSMLRADSGPSGLVAARGPWAERRALALLRQRGWWLLSRNWRCRWGELDLVLAKPGRVLVVEVKGRSPGSRDGAGRAALGWRKRQRLARAWACWLAAHPEQAPWPVEMVAALVPLPPAPGAPQGPVRWIRLEV